MKARALLVLGFGVGVGVALLVAHQDAQARAAVASDQDAGGDELLDALLAPVYLIGGIMGGMKLSAEGLQALKSREGFSATPYADAGGFSIGYGHFIRAGESFASVTEAQAAELLAADVGDAENAVNTLVRVPLSQSAFDALVSFVYNVGAGAFRRSTLLQLLNAGNVAAAAEEFRRWRYSAGAYLPALARRRDEERAQFLA